MSLPAHMIIKGKKQGEIDGSCEMEGREGTIFIRDVQHSILVPSPIADGGKRMHEPLMITKDMDKSSPKLNQALVQGESLNIVLKWYRIDQYGHEEHYFTHTLENAIIKSINLVMESETISFSYEKITWLWKPDGIETEDRWDNMSGS